MPTAIQIIFYFFATIAVIASLVVITRKNPVESVLALVVTFFCMAGVWMLLRAEFLSLILLLVYVGAVMTLFLFVVMMLNIDVEDKRSAFGRYYPVGILIAFLITALIIAGLVPDFVYLTPLPIPGPEPQNYSNVRELGALIYTEYAYAFEIAGVMLLAAIIAAITLSYRGPHKRKTQKVSQQIDINPKERVRLISMPAESREGE